MDGGAFPEVLQAMLSPLGGQLTLPQRKHLRWFLFGILMSLRSSTLLHVARVAPRGGHRTSCGGFLRSDWDGVSLLQARAIETLRWMKPRQGEAIYLIIDDTRIEKRGRKMHAVSKIYDHKSQRFIRGHMVVTGALVFRGVVLPWKFDLWIPKQQASVGYRKITQIAAQMINELSIPFELKVRVLFDAFYLAPCVAKACQSQGFTWFSVASKNRIMKRRRCQKRSINDFAAGVLRHKGQRVRLRRARFWRWMRIAHVDGKLSRLGNVRMVLSKRPGDAWKKTLAVVTNETKLAAREIMVIYEKRWNIEVLFKELRSSLGLCDYQVLSRNAIERHLHLCGMAHQLLTHHSLTAQGAKARQKNTEVSLPPLRERHGDLRREIRREQAKAMLATIKNRTDRTNIRAYLRNELQIAA
jgi:SRSO17 transposase